MRCSSRLPDPTLLVHLGASSQPGIASGFGIDIIITITIAILLTPVTITVTLTIFMCDLCAFFQPGLCGTCFYISNIAIGWRWTPGRCLEITPPEMICSTILNPRCDIAGSQPLAPLDC